VKMTRAVGLAGVAAIAAALTYHALQPPPEEFPKPPNFSYCTDPAYYVANYENPQTSPPGCPTTGQCAVYLEVYQGTPGSHSQFGADHAWIVQDKRHRYAIIGQGPGARIYPKPPPDADFALPVWNDCVFNHKSPAAPHGPTSGNYHCDGSIHPDPGTTLYADITLAQLQTKNPPLWQAFKSKFLCADQTPTPSATAPPPTVPPICPTCAATCAPATATRTPTKTFTPHFGPNPTRTPTCIGASCRTPTSASP
jgi:hypothetical protein